MTDNHQGEALFIAYLIGQQLQKNEYEAKVNALVSGGHPMGDARTIVNAWYALNRPTCWYPAWWQLIAIGCCVGAYLSLSNAQFTEILVWLALGGVCQFRARYCQRANRNAQEAAARAERVLASYGQL